MAVLAVGGIAVWQAQERLLIYAIGRAVQATGGRLSVENPRGTLLQGARVDRLQWTDPKGMHADLRDLQLQWRWRSLLRGRLVLDSVNARELTLTLGASDGPTVLPTSLALPVPLDVRSLKLARLRIEAPGSDPLVFTGIELRADYAPGRIRVERLSLSSPWGDATLQGSLADAPPFETTAQLKGRANWQSAAIDLQASGPLESLRWTGNAVVAAAPGRPAATVSAAGQLHPFAPRVLSPVALTADGLSASLFGLDAVKRGVFDGEGQIDWRSDAPAQGVRAQLELRNRDPAPVDAGGLPLSRVFAQGRWVDGRLRIDELRAATTGMTDFNLAGSLAIDPSRPITLPWMTLPAITADLRLSAVSAPLLDSRLPAGRVSGRLKIDDRQFDFELSDSQRGALALQAAGRLEGDRIELVRAQARALPGLERAQWQAQGSIQIVAPWTVDLKGRFAGVDVAALQALRPGLLDRPLQGSADGRWELAGAFADPVLGRALEGVIEIDKGVLQGQPLRGRAAGRLEGERLPRLSVDLALGSSRLWAQGAFGRPEDRLEFRLDSTSVAALSAAAGLPPLDGALNLRGTWRGTLERPELTLEGSASRLRMDGQSIGQASVNGQLDDRRLSVRAQASDLMLGGERIEQLNLRAEGTQAAHVAHVDGRRGQQQFAAVLEGALSPPRWQGTLRELQLRGPVALRLREPAPLALGPNEVVLGAAVFEGEAGTASLSRGQWQGGRFAVAGQANLRKLASLARTFGFEAPTLPPDVDPDAVTLDLKVDLAGSSTRDVSGSLAVRMIPPVGLNGSVDADLTLREGRLAGRIDLQLPTLSVANRWIGPEWSVDGQLRMAGTVSGTLAQPRLAGEVRGDALRLEQRSLGWRLGAGTLSARFEGDRLQVDRLRLYSGQAAIDSARAAPVALAAGAPPPGAIDLAGEIRLADRTGRFRMNAAGASVPLGPGQRLVVSGQATASSQAGRFEVTGQLRADEGLIELRGGDAPTLPSDVEIVGRPQRVAGNGTTGGAANGAASAPANGATAGAGNGAASGKPSADASLRIFSDVALDLGEKLRVRGSGVDARLTGTINLRGTLPDAPRAFGTVRVRDGTYSAYGQQLQIQRGRVVFNGAIDNPLLDIVAVRRNLPVEAGVALTGTVLAPRVRLTSQPDMPDAEKLSWLVLGVPLEGAQTGAQTAALQAAAASLFGTSGGGLARSLGLDVLTVRSSAGADSFASSPGMAGFNQMGAVPGQVSGSTVNAPASATTQNVVTIGKRLSSKLLVTYEQGLRGVWNLLRIQYDITSRLSLRAQTGSESALDVLYRVSFD
ncbi:MAG TPA: translocation/assembly module TamB domain-containing protein [Burkholderiaceae bacterium]|nr:translocation/assembly module TamB domain-containing protein [Burkholderiaceae bacterium]